MAKKKTSKDVSSATMTRMQELGSAWVFKRAIQDNQRFLRAQDIKTGNPKDGGKTYNELLMILISVFYNGCYSHSQPNTL